MDNPQPHVGEQINYIFRYYEALDSMRLPSIFGGQPDYEPPALTGFWAEGDIDVTSYRVSANGRIYTVTELTQVLFPTAAGEQTIDPARITITSNGLRNDAILDTEPVIVNVQPAPEGAPESFTGAVGQFDIRAELDRGQTQVDEPVTLKVTVEGMGNISTASDPVWPEIDGWRIFDADSSLSTQVENGLVSGSHTYERLMVPTAAGQFTVPAIEYSYFDPSLDQYVTVATDPMAITVAPGIGTPGPIMAAGAAANTADESVVLTADDIDPAIVASLKPVPVILGDRQPAVDSPDLVLVALGRAVGGVGRRLCLATASGSSGAERRRSAQFACPQAGPQGHCPGSQRAGQGSEQQPGSICGCRQDPDRISVGQASEADCRQDQPRHQRGNAPTRGRR